RRPPLGLVVDNGPLWGSQIQISSGQWAMGGAVKSREGREASLIPRATASPPAPHLASGPTCSQKLVKNT
ncbi:hypothetical protein PENTCL1PPCAC_2012, partial [Pristionchus entomophagus]